jgi:hypothetical protein
MLQEQTTSRIPDGGRSPDGVVAGAIILACGVLSLLVVAHHPSIHTHRPSEILGALATLNAANEIVHGLLIAFMLALAFGFSIFTLRQGVHYLTSIGGLVPYLAGVAAFVAAALCDGFFTSLYASANSNATGPTLAAVLAVLSGGAGFIQVASKFGLVAMSLGIFVWSIGLLRTPGVVRYAGVAGLVAAIVPAAMLMVSFHLLTAANITLAIVPQAVFHALIGVLLIGRRV